MHNSEYQIAPTTSKTHLREEIWNIMQEKGLCEAPHGTIPTFPGQNRAAERVRRLEEYALATTVMVPPDRPQLQVRVNAVMDGKRLIVATPGLRDGFYVFERERLRVKDCVRGLRSSGLKRFGAPLDTSLSAVGKIDLVITGAVAVGLNGDRIGKGSGYFDLEFAVLGEIGSVEETTPIIAVVDEVQLRDQLPFEPHDVGVDWIVTPVRIIRVEDRRQRHIGIWWNRLEDSRLRRMRAVREVEK
jgi:5-formyltetrahydrofolate cyclo-ligase